MQNIRDTSFNKVNITTSVAPYKTDCVTVANGVYDLLPKNQFHKSPNARISCEQFLTNEDRYVSTESSSNYSTVWEFYPFGGTPKWNASPGWSGGANVSYGRLMAYHYNDSRLGLTGFGSADIVITPQGNNGLLIDDTMSGQLRWSATLHHVATRP